MKSLCLVDARRRARACPNERTLLGNLFPPHPVFHRALADDVMLDRLTHAAQSLGSTLPYDANLEDALRPSYGNVQLYGR